MVDYFEVYTNGDRCLGSVMSERARGMDKWMALLKSGFWSQWENYMNTSISVVEPKYKHSNRLFDAPLVTFQLVVTVKAAYALC
jgi:hypothetical protein